MTILTISPANPATGRNQTIDEEHLMLNNCPILTGIVDIDDEDDYVDEPAQESSYGHVMSTSDEEDEDVDSSSCLLMSLTAAMRSLQILSTAWQSSRIFFEDTYKPELGDQALEALNSYVPQLFHKATTQPHAHSTEIFNVVKAVGIFDAYFTDGDYRQLDSIFELIPHPHHPLPGNDNVVDARNVFPRNIKRIA